MHKVSPIVWTIAIVFTFFVGYALGGYNHEKDIIHSCDEYASAERVSWTGELGFCKKLDDNGKEAIIVK